METLRPFFFIAIACICGASFAVTPKTKSEEGQVSNRTCDETNKTELRNSIYQKQYSYLSKVNLWTAVDALLCAPKTADNRKTISNLLPSTVRLEVSNTGDDVQIKTIKKDNELIDSLMAASKVWDATIRQEEKQIVVQYWSNEVCVVSRTLRTIGEKWKIVSIGQACD